MTLFGEFQFDVDTFPLGLTLTEHPDAVAEIERVVVAEELLAPYVWISAGKLAAFEATAEEDPSVERLRNIDSFDGEALYRVVWARPVEETLYSITGGEIVVLEASGNHTGWTLRIRFTDREQLTRFQSFCEDNGIGFTLERLYRETQPMTGGQYGLTDKQQEALVTAWEAGYFQAPRNATLEDVAESLGITHQSLSQRLRRAHHELIANTLVVTPPQSAGSSSSPPESTDDSRSRPESTDDSSRSRSPDE